MGALRAPSAQAVGLLVGFSLFHTQKNQFSTNIIFENRQGT
jgi:hypothetical protein